MMTTTTTTTTTALSNTGTAPVVRVEFVFLHAYYRYVLTAMVLRGGARFQGLLQNGGIDDDCYYRLPKVN